MQADQSTERPATFPPIPTDATLDVLFDDFVAALREVIASDPDALPEFAPGAGP